MTNYYLNTILPLLNALAFRGVTAQLVPCLDGWKLLFPWYEDGDIACNTATGGYLESFGFPWDDGDVTVNEAENFARYIASLRWQMTE